MYLPRLILQTTKRKVKKMYRTGAETVEVPEEAMQAWIHLLIIMSKLCELQTMIMVWNENWPSTTFKFGMLEVSDTMQQSETNKLPKHNEERT